MQNHNFLSRIFYDMVKAGIVLTLITVESCKKESILTSNIDSFPFPGQSRSVDLDGNRLVDFVFEYGGIQTDDYPSSSMLWMLNVQARDSNQIQFTSPDGPLPMEDNFLIDESIGWTDYDASLASIGWYRSKGWDSSWSGLWISVGEKNLGLRLRRENLYYYGWIKLSIDSSSGVINIVDSAYQSLSNTPIFAGIHP